VLLPRSGARDPLVLALVLALGLLVSQVGRASPLAFVEAQPEAPALPYGLVDPLAIAVSPDGAHVYVGTHFEIVVFGRAASSGRLTFQEVFAPDGVLLNYSTSLAFSADGSHLYAGVIYPGSLLALRRDPGSGSLTMVDGEFDWGGVDGLAEVWSVAVSPDGGHVYTAGYADDALGVFARDPATGTLDFVAVVRNGENGVTGLAEPTSLASSPGGEHLYAVGEDGHALVAFARDALTGELGFIEAEVDGVAGVDGLDEPVSVGVSGDGRHVYVGGTDGSVAVFARDAASGALAFLARHATVGLPPPYWRDRALLLSQDGRYLYLAGVGTFARHLVTGLLRFADPVPPTTGGVVLGGRTMTLALSPDDRHLYAPTYALENTRNEVVVLRRVATQCADAPMTGCRHPTQARLDVRDRPGEHSGDGLTWAWKRGPQTALGALGDPRTTTDYVLCVYDASSTAVFSATAPSADDCGGTSCWSATSRGFTYRHRTHPDGVRRLLLRAGTAPRSALKVNARGSRVSPPAPSSLGLPLAVQLQTSDGECWEAVHATARVQTAEAFSALGN
jgi:6-phosphogluconolactonase (cycloisomerase 2 family)